MLLLSCKLYPFVSIDKLHHRACVSQEHAAQESYKCLRLPLQSQLYTAHQIRQLKTAAVYAGRTEHLAQQLQAPFEWQPMAVHVVDPPAHLATLGLVPIHNKSASGALLAFCLALQQALFRVYSFSHML